MITVTTPRSTGEPVPLTGETTACPGLLVTPDVEDDARTGQPRYTGRWRLTQQSSGSSVSRIASDHPEDCRDLARRLSTLRLDWHTLSPRPAEWPEAKRTAVLEILKTHERDVDLADVAR